MRQLWCKEGAATAAAAAVAASAGVGAGGNALTGKSKGVLSKLSDKHRKQFWMGVYTLCLYLPTLGTPCLANDHLD